MYKRQLLNRLGLAVFVLFVVCVLVIFHDGLVNLITTPLVGGSNLPAGGTDLVSTVLYIIFTGLILIDLVVIGVGVIISFLDYKNYTFRFEEFDLIVKRGILNKEETSVPYRQMQDVDLEQNLMYQLFGVCRVVMMTAGHEDSGMNDDTETVLEPIDKTLGEEIRKLLQSRIGVQVVESEKQVEAEEQTK